MLDAFSERRDFPNRMHRLMILAASSCLVVASGRAQDVTPLYRIGSEHDARIRRAPLRGDTTVQAGFLLRSASSRTRVAVDSLQRVRVSPIAPDVQFTSNSRLPLSLNDGAMWAGRGISAMVTAGMSLTWQRLRIIAAPSVWRTANQSFSLPTDPEIVPAVPAPRSPWSSPYHWYSRSLDVPRRFGDVTLFAVDLGQSSVWMTWDRVAVGLSNEQQWWGPGQRNALLLSNNAAGFGHLFVRTPRPLTSTLGAVEASYLLGTLTASRFFESGPPTNPARSISAAAVTLAPSGVSGLTLGVSRVVIASLDARVDVSAHVLDVFRSVPSPNDLPYADPTQIRGRDQLMSLFGRWVFPSDGAEVWAEWGRADQPESLLDFSTSPGHSQAYTIGAQFAKPLSARWSVGAEFEHTKTQQSGTFRERPTGSWYTSRSVLQGFTQRGQILGAAVGPGANSQWLAMDVRDSLLSLGIFVGRIRWDDDALYTIARPNGNGLCKHDVSLFVGARASRLMSRLELSASLNAQHRLNAYYGSTGLCFIDEQRSDRHNLTLQFSVGPRFH